jgi:hexosaminidase
MADQCAARSVRSGWARRVVGCAVVLLLTLATPVPASARAAAVPPVTVPALSNWTAEQGSYSLGPGSRIVARDAAAAGSRTPSPTIRARRATAPFPSYGRVRTRVTS